MTTHLDPVDIRPLIAVSDQAACRGMPLELFFPTGELCAASGRKAVAVCRTCPIRLPCLDAALANREPAGVWGGFLPQERAEMLRHRARRT
jgi:WhiB family redox-sensing transcriptional regulator